MFAIPRALCHLGFLLCKRCPEQMRRHSTSIRKPKQQAPRGVSALLWPFSAWLRWGFVGILVSIAILCHDPLLASAVGLQTPAPPAISGEEPSDAFGHTVACSVDGELAAAPDKRGTSFWAEPTSAETTRLIVADGYSSRFDILDPIVSPRVHRTLLQVFRI